MSCKVDRLQVNSSSKMLTALVKLAVLATGRFRLTVSALDQLCTLKEESGLLVMILGRKYADELLKVDLGECLCLGIERCRKLELGISPLVFAMLLEGMCNSDRLWITRATYEVYCEWLIHATWRVAENVP